MLRGLIEFGCRSKAQPKGGAALCCAAVPRPSGSAFMPLRRAPRRPWAAWLVLLVALFGALAPTVSHALVFAKLGPNGLANGIEICTPQGPRVVVLQSDAADPLADSGPGQESARTLDHCPLCLHPAGHAAPVAQLPAYEGLSPTTEALHPTADPAPTHPSHTYSGASPRGPPARS